MFHIPTPDEWYKAAYYSQRLNKGRGGYYVFATQHDATPGSVPGNNIRKRTTPNQVNYFDAGFSVTQAIAPSASQNYLTDVGAFSKSASYYGTFDQAGNVYEWNDPQGPGSQLSLRGAYWVSNVANTSCLDAYFLPPDYESSGSGFRLASGQSGHANSKLVTASVDPVIGPLITTKNSPLSRYDSLLNSSALQRGRRSAGALRRGSLNPALAAKVEAFASNPGEPLMLGGGLNNVANQNHLNPFVREMLSATSQMGSHWLR